MDKKRLTREQAEKEINDFFKNIKGKTPKNIKKIKRLAMGYNIKLREKRKMFCQNCFSTKLRVKSIKNKVKTVVCDKCNKVMRWKIKN